MALLRMELPVAVHFRAMPGMCLYASRTIKVFKKRANSYKSSNLKIVYLNSQILLLKLQRNLF